MRTRSKVNLEMTVREFKNLSDFLEGHEYEIAISQDAYGELKELFEIVFGQSASEDS